MPFVSSTPELGEIARIPAPPPPGPRPGVLDTLSAAFRVNNEVSSLYDVVTSGFLGRGHAVNPQYDPLSDISGTEDELHADRFIESTSPAETAAIRAQIRREEADRQTIREAGPWGLAASVAAGAVAPSTLAAMVVPFGGATRLAQAARAVAGGLAVDIPSEALFHQTQVTRTASDTAFNVGGGVLLNGILGGAITPRLTRAEFDALSARLDDELRAPPVDFEGSTAGAAAVDSGTSLADEGIARGGETLAKTIGRISPLSRLLTSPARAVRRVAQQLVEVPFVLTKNERGIATPVAVETLAKRWDAALVRMVREFDEAFTAYRGRVRAEGGEPLNFAAFKREVAGAMRRSDQSVIPEAASAAARARQMVIEPIKRRAIRAGILPADVATVGAESYLPRLYDVRRIKANLTAWERMLRAQFEARGIDSAEAAEIGEQVTNSILGSTRGFVQLDPNVVVRAGNLAERIVRIPDDVLEPWLISDAEEVLSRYVRSVTPQVEMADRFGDLDLKQAFQDVVDEYAIRQERALGDDKLKAALEQRMKADLDDLRGLRDRILGKYGMPADPDSVLVRSARLFRTYNYVRLLGGQVLSSFADVGRVVMQHGLARTGRGMATLATNLNRWKLAREDGTRLAVGLDWTLNTRGATLGEIGDWAETPIERYAQQAANAFSRVTLMSTWNSSLKFLGVAIEQDHILELAGRRLAGKALSTRERTVMAQLGIDESMLSRIGYEFAQHGETDGLRRARLDLWSDREARTTLAAALRKSADTVVLTKGAGDTPLLMSNELVRTLLQFKSFGQAAVNRLVIPTAQGLARGDVATLNGLLLMLGLGTLRYAAKQWTADQPIETDAATLVREAVDGAGLTAYLVDPYDVGAAITGAPRWSRYTDRHWTETALGPTAGTITDLGLTAEGISHEGVSARDVHKIRKLLPLQNVFYVRRLINLLEEESAEAVTQ